MEKHYNVKLDLYKSEVVKKDLSGRDIQFVAKDENVYSVILNLSATNESKIEEAYAIENGTNVMVNIKPANAIGSTDIQATVLDAATGTAKVSFTTGFEVLGEHAATVYLKKDSNSLTFGQRFIFSVVAGAVKA